VGSDAVNMVEIAIEEVGNAPPSGGKYLFEMIGLYPATGKRGALVPDSMVAILLRRLRLRDPPAPEQPVTKDQEMAAAISEDEGLE
jgi:hypothetical protein